MRPALSFGLTTALAKDMKEYTTRINQFLRYICELQQISFHMDTRLRAACLRECPSGPPLLSHQFLSVPPAPFT